MQLVRLVVLAVAGVAAIAGYWQEGRRLQVIRQLSGPRARDFYEAVRTRDERVMWVVSLLLAAGAVAATVRELVQSPALPGS